MTNLPKDIAEAAEKHASVEGFAGSRLDSPDDFYKGILNGAQWLWSFLCAKAGLVWPPALDSLELYELMQAYRLAPFTDQKLVCEHFDKVRFYIRDNIHTLDAALIATLRLENAELRTKLDTLCSIEAVALTERAELNRAIKEIDRLETKLVDAGLE